MFVAKKSGFSECFLVKFPFNDEYFVNFSFVRLLSDTKANENIYGLAQISQSHQQRDEMKSPKDCDKKSRCIFFGISFNLMLNMS